MNDRMVKTQDRIFWSRVYDILVEVGGALERERDYFLDTKGDFREWRFCGYLGSGGKVWNDDRGVKVNNYPEDETEETKQIVEQINIELDELVERYEKYGIDVHNDVFLNEL